MFNADDGDFPLNGGKNKLAKLFEEEPSSAVSLKYPPLKQPLPLKQPSAPLKKKPQASPLKVLIGAAVEGFELIDGSYSSCGKVGVALLGSDSKDQFLLYLYDSGKKMLASIEIDPGFQFMVHENNYASFHDMMSRAWSLRFNIASELEEFCKRLAVCKWLLSERKESLIQEANKASPGATAKPKDIVTATYIAHSISAQGVLSEVVPSHCLSLPANSKSWICPVVGCCEQSKTFVILPKGYQADWCPDVLSQEGLLVEVTINKITVYIETTDKLEKVPSDLIARMSKIGTALPTVTPNPPLEPSVVEEKKPSDEPQPTSVPSLPTHPPSFPTPSPVMTPPQALAPHPDALSSAPPMMPVYAQPVVPPSIPQSVSPSPQTVTLHQTPFMAPSHMIAPSIDHSLFVQVNMLLSEVRTNNSELRMNLMRVADKVDHLTSKVSIALHEERKTSEEQPPESTQKPQVNLIKEEEFKKISDQYERAQEENALLKSEVSELAKSKTILQNKLDTTMEKYNSSENDLEKMLAQNEELLALNQSLSEKIEEQKGAIASLKEQMGSLHSRIQKLDAENLPLLRKVSLMSSENLSLGKQFRTAQKENALLKEEMKAAAKQRKAEKMQRPSTDYDLPAIIRRVINLSYKALSSQLGTSPLTQNAIAETLRCVASDFIENLDKSPQLRKEAQPIKYKGDNEQTLAPSANKTEPQSPPTIPSPTFESAKLSEVLGEKENPKRISSADNEPLEQSRDDNSQPAENSSFKNQTSQKQPEIPGELKDKEVQSENHPLACSEKSESLETVNEETETSRTKSKGETEKEIEKSESKQTETDDAQPPPLPLDVENESSETKNKPFEVKNKPFDSGNKSLDVKKEPLSATNEPSNENVPSEATNDSLEIRNEPLQVENKSDVMNKEKKSLNETTSPSEGIDIPQSAFHAPLLKPEPPPFSLSPSSSPPKHETEQIHIIEQKEPVTRKSSVDSPWRTEPPPLFESDDDEWLN